MKNIVYIFVILLTLFACNDEESLYGVKMLESDISFHPFPGGCVMKYNLPKDKDMHLIQATYKNYKGELKTVKGSYVNDSLVLKGFIDANENIPLNVSLIDKFGNVSEVLKLNFSVEKSAPKAFIDNLNVSTYWNGFMVNYNAPEKVDGFAHIAYVGMNEMTQELDTLLIESFQIEEGENNKKYSGYTLPDTDVSTVIVWSEDFDGNIAGKKIFNDIKSVSDEKIINTDFDFIGSSYEDEEMKVSWKYLFDGDIKGSQRVENGDKNKAYTFASERYSVPGDWVIDTKEQRVLSRIKLYASLFVTWQMLYPYDIWNSYDNLLPSDVDVYVSKDNNNWIKVGDFFQSVGVPRELRWGWPSYDEDNQHENIKQLEEAEPCFLQIEFDYSMEKYRYIKLNVKNTFKEYYNVQRNPYDQFTCHEIEVFGLNNN